jgi:hypothetical protein
MQFGAEAKQICNRRARQFGAENDGHIRLRIESRFQLGKGFD